jgi:predicted transcriptional regulator
MENVKVVVMADAIGILSEVSATLGSQKRTFMLYVLKDRPMGYTQIARGFKDIDVKIGSSEIYKHLDMLQRGRYVAKRKKTYMITLKGMTLVKAVEDLSKVPERIPHLARASG